MRNGGNYIKCKKLYNLHNWHLCPLNPGVQEHRYPFSVFAQDPPFKQGVEKQGSTVKY